MMTWRFLALGTLIAGALTACGPTPESPTSAATESTSNLPFAGSAEAFFVPSTGTYELFVTVRDTSVPYTISVSDAPDGSDADVIIEDATEIELTWQPDEITSDRRYFVLETEGTVPLVFSTRRVPLESDPNFRDIGGYLTPDEKVVAWGKVFRSGALDTMTAEDQAQIEALGIAAVIDLRPEDERSAPLSDLLPSSVDYQTFDEGPRAIMEALATTLETPDVTADEVREAVVAYYDTLLDGNKDAHRALFDTLANRDLPVLISGTAGKDRTGVAAALVLSALGVYPETVIADYATSHNSHGFLEIYISRTANGDFDEDGPFAALKDIPKDVAKPIFMSDKDYIRTLLDQLDTEYGSVINYIQTELDVDDAELAAIRERLLR